METSPEFDARWLYFKDAGVERGFLASRQAQLLSKLRLGIGLALSYLILSIVIILVTDQGWPTSGHLFVVTDEGRRLSELRNWIVISMTLLTSMVIVVTKMPLAKCGLSPRGFELFLSCLMCLAPVLLTLQHPWYLAKACGVSDPWPHLAHPFHARDEKLLLVLDVFVTGCHLLLPIRWISLLPAEVAVVLCYAAAGIGFGSESAATEKVVNVGLMTLLVVTAALGKRALERHERFGFAQLAKERTLRAEAEHKLWREQEKTSHQRAGGGAQASLVEADSVSLPTTTHTGELFAMRQGDLPVESQLDRIVELGVQEHWLIKPEDLQPLPDRILGAGGFGLAVVARFHGAEVVLKAPRLSQDRATKKALFAASEELRIFRRLHHPNIVGFYGASIDSASSELVLVLEYIQGQELQKAVQGIPSSPHAIVDRCVLADNICSALGYLHAQTPIIMHGDIKSSNVLIQKLAARRNAKLVDFGLSRLLTRGARNLGGTLSWMAPEVIRKESAAGAPSADVFSFGRLVFMIMTGRKPLQDVSREEIIAAACSRDSLDLEWPEDMPLLAEARGLCDACLRPDPAQRASIAETQAALRGWGSSVALPGGVAAQLREALPPEGGSSGSLHEALERARHAAAQGVPQTRRQQQQQQQQQQHHHQKWAGMLQFLEPEEEDVPDASNRLTSALAMTYWKMQCPVCKLVGFNMEEEDGTCQMCKGASVAPTSASARGPSQQRPVALQSLSEEPEEEDDQAAMVADGARRTVASL